MKKIMGIIGAVCALSACCGGNEHKEQSNIPAAFVKDLVAEMLAETSAVTLTAADQAAALLERGVSQAAFLWRESDGSPEEFAEFVKKNYASTPEERKELYDKLAKAMETIYGASNQLSVDLQKPTILAGPEPGNVDYILSSYDPLAHLNDDFFANKLAFITVLNFPAYSLAEKNALGKDWSRLEWAYARMGDIFTSRIPAAVNQKIALAQSNAENYIASYNIMMDHLLDSNGEKIFPEGQVLLSHWNLRDELKSNYADVPNAARKQELIYKVMERIVSQEIPAAVINNPEYDWDPYSNRCFKAREEVKLEAEGAERYARILEMFHAYQEEDPYCAQLPDAILRNFEGSMEVPADEIEALFTRLLSSEQVRKVAALIKERLGRDLRPYDIWYDGFKGRTGMPEDRLSEITRKRYPNPAAYEADMPRMFQALGFSPDYAEYIADKIAVEGARGSGHAWGTMGKGYKSFLRTRIAPEGMDYKGYNIAVHEMGHNVEQTIDTYDIDYYTLSGVPNTAFTETLAFVFQKRDLQLLGFESQVDDNTTLDIFWGMYEIMGVSLVDMYTWRWLYANPDATATELRDNCLRIAREVWNLYFEPVLGTHDSTILAVYSHMVNSPMYLPNYPFGHIVEYQIEEHLSKLPDPRKIGPEVERIWKIGRLTPQAWMNEAVGSDVSIDPILKAIDRIIP